MVENHALKKHIHKSCVALHTKKIPNVHRYCRSPMIPIITTHAIIVKTTFTLT